MKGKEDNECTIEDFGFESIEKILAMISGKWKIQIIYHLSGNANIRYGQLKRKLTNVSHKVLSEQLKELEKNGLVLRKEYLEDSYRVEYRLTNLGLSLLPVYEVLAKWYEENKESF